MTDEEYYWEKAEFQDPRSHRMHVENYKKGIHSSIAFDEQYMKEALLELYEEYKRAWCDARGYRVEDMDEEVGINGECYACFNEWYDNEYTEL